MNKKIILRGLGFAFGEVAYVSLVAFFMFNMEKFFGSKPDSAFAPVAFLILLVISAAVSAALVFGGPVLLYLEGKKKDAIRLFIYTISWLVVFLFVALSFLAR